MKQNKLLIGKNELIFFLLIYLAGILVWDYTYIYQAALVIMLIITACVYKGKKIQIRPYIIVSLILFMYFLIYTVLGFSCNSQVSVEYLISLSINIVAAMVCEQIIIDNIKIEIIMRFWIKISLAISIYICIMGRSKLFSGELGEAVQKPLTGGGYSHNDIALVAAFAIVFLNYFRVNKIKIRFNYLSQLFLVLFIILTGARKSLLLAIAGMIVYPLMFSGDRKKVVVKTGKILIAIVLILVAFYALLTNKFLYDLIGYRFAGYFSGVTGGTFTESSAITRSVMKETAIALIKQKPIFGWGLNTFRTFKGSFGTWSHVNYYELWVSGGIIAVIIYYSFYLYAIIKLIKIKESKMRGMFLVIMLFMFVMDYLSITYVSRFMGIIYVMVDSYIANQRMEVKNKDYV